MHSVAGNTGFMKELGGRDRHEIGRTVEQTDVLGGRGRLLPEQLL